MSTLPSPARHPTASMEALMTSSQGFNFVREYWIDAWQRSDLMLDVLRERGYEIIDCPSGTPGHVRATLSWRRSVTLLNTSEGVVRPEQAHRVAGRGQGQHPPRSRSRGWQLAGRAADLYVKRRRRQHHAGRQAVDHFDQFRRQSQEPDGVGRFRGPACPRSTLSISRRSRPSDGQEAARGATAITHLRKPT